MTVPVKSNITPWFLKLQKTMAILLTTHALLLASFPGLSVAARVESEDYEQDESGEQDNSTWWGSSDEEVEDDGGVFQCPEQCWQCCSAHSHRALLIFGGWGTSDTQFKCILRDPEELPSGRQCEQPVARTHDEDSIKSICTYNTGESSGRPGEHCQTQGSASKWAEWLWQKKGEVFGLANANVAEMTSIISSIRSNGREEDVVLPLVQLSSIHPVDEPGAILKTAGRARAARAARSLLDEEPCTMTKAWIASSPALKEFQSVTGFLAVKIGEDDYTVFDGNGRVVALLWAFPEGDELREKLKVEVTEFVIDDEKERNKIVQRIQTLQESMGSLEFRAIQPPSLDENEVKTWAKGVKAELKRLKAGKAPKKG